MGGLEMPRPEKTSDHFQTIHEFAVFYNRRCERILEQSNRTTRACIITKGVLPQSTTHPLVNDKKQYGLRTSPKQWQEHLNTILQKLGFTRLKSDACAFINTTSRNYIMAYVDDLLVVRDNATTQLFLQQFQQHLELNDKNKLHLSFSARQWPKNLKLDLGPYNMDKCNPSTTPGKQKNTNCSTTS
eukprot:1672319-Amphidinium_carterae.1